MYAVHAGVLFQDMWRAQRPGGSCYPAANAKSRLIGIRYSRYSRAKCCVVNGQQEIAQRAQPALVVVEKMVTANSRQERHRL
jgi:hypothetical protein